MVPRANIHPQPFVFIEICNDEHVSFVSVDYFVQGCALTHLRSFKKCSSPYFIWPAYVGSRHILFKTSSLARYCIYTSFDNIT